MSSSSRVRIAERIHERQAAGRYTISLEEIDRTMDGSRIAHQSAIRRLKERGRLVSPRRGFYVIVPPEYASTGSPPASWFVDDLMGYLQQPYYVGLLSAAATHGAAHQHPQVFQVVTTQATASMTAGRVRLEFFRKRNLEDSSTTRVNTEMGTMRVSTPEATVFDLLRHVQACGHLDNVATVIAVLADVITPRAFTEAAAEAHVTEVQRAGYLLELVGRVDLAQALESFLDGRQVPIALLRPGAESKGVPKSERWKLALNEHVEPDLSS